MNINPKLYEAQQERRREPVEAPPRDLVPRAQEPIVGARDTLPCETEQAVEYRTFSDCFTKQQEDELLKVFDQLKIWMEHHDGRFEGHEARLDTHVDDVCRANERLDRQLISLETHTKMIQDLLSRVRKLEHPNPICRVNLTDAEAEKILLDPWKVWQLKEDEPALPDLMATVWINGQAQMTLHAKTRAELSTLIYDGLAEQLQNHGYPADPSGAQLMDAAGRALDAAPCGVPGCTIGLDPARPGTEATAVALYEPGSNTAGKQAVLGARQIGKTTRGR